jgi:hypothetical protein
MVIMGRMDIIRRMHITGMSVVRGGRGAGGSLVTTGIIGRIDIIPDRMDIADRHGASAALIPLLRLRVKGF